MKKSLTLFLCLTLLFGLIPASHAEENTSTDLLTPAESTIYLAPIPDLADNFIRGMDASSVLVEEASGVKYYNFAGEEQDVFQTLAEAGVNYIRLRVWNDPYDAEGHGYGGGNNDVAKAIEMGLRATKYGMKVCIDFHYSDFWADPKRQHAPKAWAGMTVEEKADALYAFTVDSLTALLEAGVDVGMVQVGNEINNGMSGETEVPAIMKLLAAGSRGVRDVSAAFGQEMQVTLHYTNINDPTGIERVAAMLMRNEIDYDVLGLSYYPFWHGDMENMQAVARKIQSKYGKQVVIAETSYVYTAEDGDGTGNSVSGAGEVVEGYPVSVQGQATMIRDICAAANEAGVLGVFYWEGVWIPVGEPTANNSSIWEQYGSGWASSYAGDYDPEDAGLYYGGCSWDNQAMFDFTGHPLESLNVFKYLKTGATAPLAIIDVQREVEAVFGVFEPIVLPATVRVLYNNPSANTDLPVTWDEADIAAIDNTNRGTYTVKGAIETGDEITCRVEIRLTNMVPNPSFEDADLSMWKVTYTGENPTDFQHKADDAKTGQTAFHFWSGTSDMDFAIEQTLTDLVPGTYQLSVYAQGGDMSADATMELYAITSDGEQTAPFMVTGWAVWQNPTIPTIKVTDGTLTIGVRFHCNVKSWGTVDDFTLIRLGD